MKTTTQISSSYLLAQTTASSLPNFLARLTQKTLRRNSVLKEHLVGLTLHYERLWAYMNFLMRDWKSQELLKYQAIKASTTACKLIYECPMAFVMFEADSRWTLTCDLEQYGENSGVKGGSVKTSVDDFIEAYGKTCAWKIVATGEDSCGLKQVYDEYMQSVRAIIEDKVLDRDGNELTPQEKQSVYNEIESYILMRLHDKLFAHSPSEDDKLLLNKLTSLSWMTPVHLGLKDTLHSLNFWEIAATSKKGYECRAAEYEALQDSAGDAGDIGGVHGPGDGGVCEVHGKQGVRR